ncbi:MAG: DinB family protein [Candidatus Dormibacteraceae bacterium]
MDWTQQLVEQLDWHWQHQLRPRLDGLTDEEYFWEPAPGCWSLRPRGEAGTPLAAGAGALVLDYAFPAPLPPPVTTIAWRLAHLLVGVFGMRVEWHFGGPSISFQSADYPATAAEALTQLDEVYGQWIAGVRALDPTRLAAPIGPPEPFPELPFAALVLHINREAIHHGAEIALLRDLYQWRG